MLNIVQWSVSYFQFLQVLGWNICGNIFPVGTDESEQTSDTVWEFYWIHNNFLTIATKLHIRSGRRMRFVSKTWKLQLDTAIYEYEIYYVYVSTYFDDSLKDLCKRSTIPTGKDHPVWLWEAHWRERNEWKYWASKSFVGSDWFSPLRRVTEVGQSSRLTR